MGKLADMIADGGHNVTSLIPIIDTDLPPDRSTKTRKIFVEQSVTTKELHDRFDDAKVDLFTMNIHNPIGSYMFGNFFGGMFASQCRATLEEPGLILRLKAEKFDVMLMEHFDMCGVGLVELIQPKTFISVSTTVAFGPELDEFGIPDIPSFSPALYVSSLNVHSIWDRLRNLYARWQLRFEYNYIRSHVLRVFREKFGASFPSLEEISSRSAYVFTNGEPLIDFATPTISKVIPLGGLGAKKPENLTEEWESILSLRPRNILLSFGSVARSADFPLATKMSILKMVQSFPDVTFIWKYEREDDFTKDIASKVSNLVTTKWMPQGDLLAHPRMAVFITHGGMGSIQEIASRGVPGVFVPLFGDQPRNAGMMEHNGLGKVFSKFEVSNPVKFTVVVREVLESDKYRKNAQHMKAILRKKPFHVKDLVVRYTEFAAEFGSSRSLRPQSHDMNWIEYHNVDIILIGGLILLLLSSLILQAAYSSLRLILVERKLKKKTE